MTPAIERLEAIITPAVTAAGCALWGVEYAGAGRRGVLRVFIDKEDGVSIADCERVSHQLSALLDVEDPIPGAYTLEVSSPGLDRILFRKEQYAEAMGQRIDVRTSIAIDGRRRFEGRLLEVDDDVLTLEDDEQAKIAIELAAVRRARVVPSL